jgi:hypothetical protein
MNSFFTKVKADGKMFKGSEFYILVNALLSQLQILSFFSTERSPTSQQFGGSRDRPLVDDNSRALWTHRKQQEAGRLGTEHGSRQNCPTSESGKRYKVKILFIFIN